MPRILKIIAIAIPVALVVTLCTVVSYRIGVHNTRELILHGNPKSETSTPSTEAEAYAKGLATLRDQLNRVTNDYDAACANYQTLYAAYEALYAYAGAESGQEKLPRPGSARGNDVPCYR